MEMESLVGKIAFLQPTGDSLYGSGDVAVVQHTPTSLHGYYLAAGYEGSKLRSFSMIGKRPWEVIAVRDCARELLEHADRLEEFSREPERCAKNGTKKQWIDSVYHDAATAARTLRALAEKHIAHEVAINETCGDCEGRCEDGTLYLNVPAGVQRIVIDL